jgi:thiol-disulfide isomerase/thioredoxin
VKRTEGEIIMKRILALFISALLLVSLASCGTSSAEQPGETEAAVSGDKVGFSATEINGGTISLEDLADKKVIMLNFFEVWCGPCLSEIPDLEELYKEYSGSGFAVVGVFTGSSSEDEVLETVKELGVTYPVFRDDELADRFGTGYVPTTVFIDGEGNLLSDTPEVGAKDRADWENVIKGYLQ